MSEPRWLTWARELQALAQTGLAFSRDPFDRQRYERLRALAGEMFAAQTDETAERIVGLFAAQEGYATPKVEVRAGVFDDRGRILMVREVLDQHRWTLPGGWADVNLSAADNLVKEVREESGYEVRIQKLAAVWDRTRQGHTAGSPWSCYKLFFVCGLTGGAPLTSVETSEIGWFARDAVPVDLSLGRVLPRQIARLFEHLDTPSLPTDYD